MLRFLMSLVLLVAPAPVLMAQASLSCPMRPATLDAMRHCYRPLIVFSPSPTDARLRKQGAILDASADDMMDRFVMLTPIVPHRQRYKTPLDTPYIVLSQREMQLVRARYHIPRERFEVLLLDENGRVLIRADRPVAITRINHRIDALPERQVEMRRKDAY